MGNFADPQYRLTRQEQKDISSLAHARYMPGLRLTTWSVLTIVAPILLLMKFAVPPIIGWLGYAGVSSAKTIAVAIIVLISWPLSAFVYGQMYVTPIRKAMRDRGYDICLGCGYLLNQLPAEITACPECGRRRESAPTDVAPDVEPTSGDDA